MAGSIVCKNDAAPSEMALYASREEGPLKSTNADNNPQSRTTERQPILKVCHIWGRRSSLDETSTDET